MVPKPPRMRHARPACSGAAGAGAAAGSHRSSWDTPYLRDPAVGPPGRGSSPQAVHRRLTVRAKTLKATGGSTLRPTGSVAPPVNHRDGGDAWVAVGPRLADPGEDQGCGGSSDQRTANVRDPGVSITVDGSHCGDSGVRALFRSRSLQALLSMEGPGAGVDGARAFCPRSMKKEEDSEEEEEEEALEEEVLEEGEV